MAQRSFAGMDLSARPIVVAEIGNNHEGSIALARDLVRRAATCGHRRGVRHRAEPRGYSGTNPGSAGLPEPAAAEFLRW